MPSGLAQLLWTAALSSAGIALLAQVLYGNVACSFVPHLAQKDVTGSAYCDARARVPLAAFQTLLTTCTARMAECVRDTGSWLGHRLLLIDGCHFSMPDVPELGQHFGYPSGQAEGCGFPVAHWLALVHYGAGLVQKAIVTRGSSADLPSVTALHPELEPGGCHHRRPGVLLVWALRAAAGSVRAWHLSRFEIADH
jgi:hypothetical protein